MSRTTILLFIGLSAAIQSVSYADESREGIEFFEKRIRPVLVEHCYKCHSSEAKSPKGGLLLDTREATRLGGDSGHAVIPNDPDESLLLSAMKFESFEMPPSGQLDDGIIEDFETWIEMGSPDPRKGKAVKVQAAIDIEAGREFWSFQPPREVQPPKVKDDQWPLSDIDRFVLQKLEQAGLQPVGDATREKLIRRLSFDLIGLPPTPEEIDEFVSDTSPDAYEKLVDRLLQSERFGERWGRHWLDVVRYAESMGKTRNYPFPFAWRYRDYVIDAFNKDKPYDQFIREQLAGDLLKAESDEARDEQLVATGYLALGSHDLNQRNAAAFTMDVVGEQIDMMGRSVMALTLACARCHDHKFDPIPTADYYAMAGIFRSTQLLNGYQNRGRNQDYRAQGQFHELKTVNEKTVITEPKPTRKAGKNAVKPEQVDKARRAVQALRKQMKKLAQNDELTPRERRARANELRQEVQAKQKRFQELKAKLARQVRRRQGGQTLKGPFAMGVVDHSKVNDCPINIRGDVARKGDMVPRGFLQVIHVENTPAIPEDQSGRRQLAEWLTRNEHPLTARVMVNRIWHHLFGSGIVRTVDNFGATGETPSHPELLDYLAIRFMQDGWSVKQLIREVVLSRTYQLDSRYDEKNYEVDPDNRLVWRMNQRRLEVELIRDALLFVSGELNLTSPKGSVVQDYAIGEIGRGRGAQQPMGAFPHRSVYLPIVRSRVPAFMTTFDFPEPSEVKGRRDVTTVPTQALFMMNSPVVYRHARSAANRLMEKTSDDRERVQLAYRATLGRTASNKQVDRTLEYVRDSMASAKSPRAPAAELGAWTDVYHALLASAEFRYRD